MKDLMSLVEICKTDLDNLGIKYITMINNAVDIYRVDGQILLITKEEIQAYYYDQKNLVDVVEIMNNRVKVYKDEQR